MIDSCRICSISFGTPGSETTAFRSVSTIKQGAVPTGFRTAIAPLGIYASRFGHGFTRGIIYCWTESAGGDHDLGAVHGVIDRLGDAFHIIADGDGAIEVHAHAAQRARNIARVRVYNFTQ